MDTGQGTLRPEETHAGGRGKPPEIQPEQEVEGERPFYKETVTEERGQFRKPLKFTGKILQT